jgi:predicted metal-dependent phosphoesterase TrpH
MLVQARIDFKKPEIPTLLRKGYTLYDMHFHTKYSDGITKPETIIKKAKKLGINVAITDHNVIEGAIKTYKIKEKVNIIPGIELTTQEGIHILAYFYNINELTQYYQKHVMLNKGKDPLSFLNVGAEYLVDSARQYNCILSAAHPFAISWTGLCKHITEEKMFNNVLSKIDALEIINGANTKNANKKALEFVKQTNKGITAGTDGHTAGALGNVLTYTKQPNQNTDDFLNSITKKTNYIIGKETWIIKKAASHSLKIKMPMKDTVNKFKKGLNYLKIRKMRKIQEKIMRNSQK